MKNNTNIGLILVTIIVAAVFLFSVINLNQSKNAPEKQPQQEEPVMEEEEDDANKLYINVFFIGQNKKGEEVYRAVKREYDPDIDGTPIEFALISLFNGPKPDEVKFGVYSEIPVGTRLQKVVETDDGVYVDVSEHFSLGGGTDSIYKRIFQLIKTAKYNTKKPVYLLINDEKVDVIGGDGIMLTQPLNENSLSE
ncbi:GerMN domain-containing protein [bacterium]|nr:GerMN domain-containing protein [bacterium]